MVGLKKHMSAMNYKNLIITLYRYLFLEMILFIHDGKPFKHYAMCQLSIYY